jgi:hypothetical protein
VVLEDLDFKRGRLQRRREPIKLPLAELALPPMIFEDAERH